MDSDSSRSRIDQFFASKKKRTLSPKTVKESSPSAKGSLESYLVTSQNESVKRNLALEIELSAKNESKETLVPCDSSLKCMDRFAPSRVVQREESVAGKAGGGVDSVDNLEEVQGPEDAKLKQFAMNFLSLYCSGVQASSLNEQKLNEHKRCGSPSLLVVEGTSPKKRHYISDKDISLPDQKTPSFDKGASDHVSCSSFSKVEEKVVNSSIGVDCDKDSSKLQVSIRKCNKISDSTSLLNGCSTPAALCKNTSARETPVSTRGSSIFSPGEAFWNEAIHVADGLLAQTGKKSIQVTEDTNISKTLNDRVSHNCGERILNSNSSAPVDIDSSSSKQTELDTTMSKKYGEIREKEASPLPVKHFDFSCDDKNLDESVPSHLSSRNREDCSAVNEHALSNFADNNRLPDKNAVLTGSEVQLHTLVHKGATPVSGAEDRDKFISDSPNRYVCVASGTSDGVSTPSSSRPLEDRLDLSNWLPPTICNIYRLRGMSKLYPWQVDCLQMDGVLQKRNLVYCASTR